MPAAASSLQQEYNRVFLLQLPYQYDSNQAEQFKGVTDIADARAIAGMTSAAPDQVVRRKLRYLIRPAMRIVDDFEVRGDVENFFDYWYAWSLLSCTTEQMRS